MLDEHRAARCDIHLGGRASEARARRVGTERVTDVVTSSRLVEETQGDLLAERPFYQCVVLPAHQHEKQRQMRAFAHAVAVQVDPTAHLVPVATRVERLAVQRHDLQNQHNIKHKLLAVQ